MELRILYVCVCVIFSFFLFGRCPKFYHFFLLTLAAFSGSVKVLRLLSLARTKCHNWTPLVFLLLPALLSHVQILQNSFHCTFPDSLWHWCYHSPALVVGFASQPVRGGWTQFLMQTSPLPVRLFLHRHCINLTFRMRAIACARSLTVRDLVVSRKPLEVGRCLFPASNCWAPVLFVATRILRLNVHIFCGTTLQCGEVWIPTTWGFPVGCLLIFPSDATSMRSSRALLLSSGTNSEISCLELPEEAPAIPPNRPFNIGC